VTIFGRLFNATIESPEVPISSANIVELFGGEKVDAGVTVDEVKSLGLSAVWCAVTLLAGTIGSLPLHAYRESEGAGRVKLTSGRAAALLSNPHPDMTPMELWEVVVGHLLLWGNAYLWKGEDQLGRLREFWPIHPGRVRAGRASDGTKVYSIDGEAFADREILHIPGFGYDGVCGVSPVRAARQGLGLAMAAEKFGAKLFGSGSLATGILQTEQRLDAGQADQIQARWQAKRAGLENAHSTIVLDSGAKWTQLTIPPEDAQFLQSRAFQISEIARMFRVPPHMLMDTDKSTSWGTGIEQQSIGFVTYTLRPWLVRIEQRLSRVIRPEAAYAHFSVEGLLRGDSKQRADFYREMWSLGAFNTDDILALEERPPVPDGKGQVRYRPLNFGLLGTADDTTGAPADA